MSDAPTGRIPWHTTPLDRRDCPSETDHWGADGIDADVYRTMMARNVDAAMAVALADAVRSQEAPEPTGPARYTPDPHFAELWRIAFADPPKTPVALTVLDDWAEEHGFTVWERPEWAVRWAIGVLRDHRFTVSGGYYRELRFHEYQHKDWWPVSLGLFGLTPDPHPDDDILECGIAAVASPDPGRPRVVRSKSNARARRRRTELLLVLPRREFHYLLDRLALTLAGERGVG